MFKKVFSFQYLVCSLLSLFLFYTPVSAASNNSFVSIVNPIRGDEFWDLKNEQPIDVVKGEIEILRSQNLPATFLFRFDALNNPQILSQFDNNNFEKGLFLEVTPSLSKTAGVNYHQSASWHNAASVLLTGYGVEERKKLIDTDFNLFKQKFGVFPHSVGAWWIDANSLNYMQQKYQITNALIVADQYSTDSYQIWGQYWGTPYYPRKNNALFPAQDLENKIPIVITQWATRDPVNGYGTGVEESTYSVQVNDYVDYHNLNTNYFSKLVDIYTQPENTGNQFGQVVVGLENSYSWTKYKSEYQNQISSLITKQKSGQIKVISLENFASWYKGRFPNLSPKQVILADDPLGSNKKALWFMNDFYRVGWVYNNEGSVIRDLRQYVSGQDEICLNKACNEVNFATFATRVLDDVTYGQKLVIDEGLVSNIAIKNQNDKTLLVYDNQLGQQKTLGFLDRDIEINGKISSIDGAILDSINKVNQLPKTNTFNNQINLKSSFLQQIGYLLLFGIFVIAAFFIPGKVLNFALNKRFENSYFLDLIIGIVTFTLIGFLSQILFKNYFLENLWVFFNVALFIYLGLYKIKVSFFSRNNFIIIFLIISGTIFLAIPTFRNGLEYGYGMGFWGPNAHDGIWHISLINQLQKSLPADNPVFAGIKLENYHYFYDLLVAITSNLINVPAFDLLFREFPILFGFILGLSTLSFLKILTGKSNVLISALALYFVYTAGSFGWIVELIKHQGLNGESDFWANQAISFNLNPPFMISLLILVAFFELFSIYLNHSKKILLLPLIVLSGSLLEFKAYGAILLGLALVSLIILDCFKKRFRLIPLFIGMGLISLILLLPNYPSILAIFQTNSNLFEFSPFWFINSMIDSPDRLGLTRLSLTRISGFETRNWIKILGVEFVGLILFLVGNLGIRFLGLINLFSIFKNKKTIGLFLLIFSCFSVLIPLLFIQKGTPWNTIQFFYYFLFISAIFTAVTLGKLYTKLPKPLSALFVILLLIIAPINCIIVAKGYFYPQPHAFLSQKEEEGLVFLKEQEPGRVLTFPYDQNLKKSLDQPLPLLAYDSTSYVSALSKKTTFVEDQEQQEILGTDYKSRILEAKNFFLGQSLELSLNFLRTNKISYIYLPKIYGITLDDKKLNLDKLFENEEVVIFKFNY